MLQRSYVVSTTLISRRPRVPFRFFTSIGPNQNDPQKGADEKKPEAFEQKPKVEKAENESPGFVKEEKLEKEDESPQKFEKKVDRNDRQSNGPSESEQKGIFYGVTDFRTWRGKFFNRKNLDSYRNAFARNGIWLFGIGFFTFYTVLFALERQREKSKITHNVS